MRARPRPPTRLRVLLSAGAVLVLPFASCLNPQPDDFPQTISNSPDQGTANRAPAEVELAPAGGTPGATPAPSAPTTGVEAPPVAADPSPGDSLSGPASAAPDADAGAPPDGGLPDAAPAVAQ